MDMRGRETSPFIVLTGLHTDPFGVVSILGEVL
nr:MAG TPA: hypothetical protein [Caudoviricetes sp.]